MSSSVVAIKKAKVKLLIQEYFGDVYPVALAVFTAESGLNPRAQGWNCMYGDKSMACKPEDRHKAWSSDCGVAQLNFRGLECPKEAFDPEWNIKKAREWKYNRSGWRPWSAYNSGSYLQFLGKSI